MVNLMNMTDEECAELIDVLEREQAQLQLGSNRLKKRKRQPSNPDRQDILRRLLWKAKSGSSTPGLLDPTELIENRLAGYC